MPLVTVKDPATGETYQLYQPPTAAPAAPKPVAPKPTPVVAPAPAPAAPVASAPSSNPLDQLGKAVQGGLQNLAKDVSDRGKEPSALVGAARGATRMAYSAVRNTAQELSDVGSEVVAAVQGKPSPTSSFTKDAPFLGIAPPLPKAKSSGGVEDFVVGIGQFAMGFGPATKAVTAGAKGISKIPAAARVIGKLDDVTTAATTAVKGSKAAQAIAAIPVAGPVAKLAGKAIAAGVKDNVATKGAAAGALVDFLVYDQYEGRLTDLIAKVGGPFEVFALDYLKSDPKDVGLTGRLKNVIEGAGAGAFLGTGTELLVQTFKATRAMRAASKAADSAKRTELIQLAVKERAKLDEVLIKQRDLPNPLVDEIKVQVQPTTPRAPDPRIAVMPVGNTNMAAAAIDPPTPKQVDPQLAPKVDPPRQIVTADDIDLPDTAFRKLTNAKANSAAEAYRSFYNAGQTPENQIDLAQALAAVRAKGKRFVADGIPGLDLDQALRDMQTGRFTPEVEKLRNAYVEAYIDKPMTRLAPTVDPQLAPRPEQLDPQLDPPVAAAEEGVPPVPQDPGDVSPVPPDGGDVPPVPPVRGDEPPAPGDPNFPDTYPAKFIAAFDANTAAIKAGDATIEDMLVNNVQKFESPSKQTAYVNTVPEDAVKAYRSFSDIVSRADTFKTMNNAELEAAVEESLKAHGYNVNVVLSQAQRSIDFLAKHRENLEATLSLQLAVDDFNAKAGIAASEYLVGAADGSPEHMRLITNMMGAAINAKVLNESLIKITRPLGALFQALQIARGDVGSRNFVADMVNMPDVRTDITKELEAKADASIPEEIGRSISTDLEEALTTGEFDSKTLAELDALAGTLTQMSETKGFSRKAFKAFGNKGELLVRGLIILRASNLLSSGSTIMANIMSNALRLFQLPVATATGLVMRGEWTAAGHSMMMFNHYIYNMKNAFRLTNESFKAGRSLFDIDQSSIDALGKEAATRKRFEDEGIPPENIPEWDLNTTPWLNVQDKSNWAIAQRRVWQGLNMSTRTQVTLDTFFKTLSGSAFEYTRNLEPGMKRAMEQGMDPNSPEAWKFAQEFAQEVLDQQITSLTIDGREILGAVMTGPHAQTAMRYTTFTDDIWAEGINGFNIPNYARTMSVMPAVWQKIIDAAPIAALIQPFNRTPGDIVKSAARMTFPINFLVDTYHRDINSGDKFTRARAEGDVAVGAMAISAGLLAMTTGYLQFAGSGPERDRVAMDKWRKDGWIPYSVRVRLGTDELGNTEYSRAVSMKALEPFTSIFGALGQFTDIANSLSKEERDKLGTAILFDVMLGVATGQLSKSYYQGFHEFMEFTTSIGELGSSADKATRVEKYFAKMAASLMPFRSAFNAARRQIDPALRVVEPGVEGEFLDSNLRNFPMRLYNQVLGELQNGIAGLSENLPERLNWIDGQPMYSASIFGSEFLPPEYPWMRGFLQFSPTSAFPIGDKISVVDREMALLHGKGAEFKGPSATDWGMENRLSAAELNRYIKITATTPNEYGQTLYQGLLYLMKSKHYQGLPREAPRDSTLSSRAIEINRVISGFKKRGKQEYENQNPVFANRIMSAEDLNNLAKYRAKYGREAPLFPVVGK